MMNNNFKRFYEELAVNLEKSNWEQVLNEDGTVLSDDLKTIVDAKTVDVLNCINNPFYFMDKLKIDNRELSINMPNYLAIKYNHQKSRNILLDTPPQTGKTVQICGYILYKLMYDAVMLNNQQLIVAIETNRIADHKARVALIKELYDSLPDHLKIIEWRHIRSRIHYYKTVLNTVNITDDQIGLLVYDGCTEYKDIKQNIPTIICARGVESIAAREALNKHAKPNFVEVKYNYKQLGYSDEWAKDMLAKYNGDLTTFLREVCQVY